MSLGRGRGGDGGSKEIRFPSSMFWKLIWTWRWISWVVSRVSPSLCLLGLFCVYSPLRFWWVLGEGCVRHCLWEAISFSCFYGVWNFGEEQSAINTRYNVTIDWCLIAIQKSRKWIVIMDENVEMESESFGFKTNGKWIVFEWLLIYFIIMGKDWLHLNHRIRKSLLVYKSRSSQIFKQSKWQKRLVKSDNKCTIMNTQWYTIRFSRMRWRYGERS